jgi:Flp pilus assembly protein TadD
MVGATTERERKAETLFEEAKRKISEQDYSGAVSCLREAVELFPNSAKYRLVLGTTLSAFPTFIGEAEIHLRRVAQLEPANVTPLIALGQMYLKAGLKPQAEKAFHDVLKIDPFSKIARDALGAPEPEKPKSFLDRLFKG